MTGVRARTARLRAARWLIAGAIFGSAMGIGAVHLAVLVPVVVALLLAVALSMWGAEPVRVRRSASIVLFTSVALGAWTALELVPLPLSLLVALSPHTADVWARCLTPLGRGGPLWATLSLDPGATRVQLLRGVAYALAFLGAARISVRREGVQFLERAVIATVLALALAAFVHPLLGAEKVYGFYAPRRDPGIRHVAPLLNSNVLSGYLNIGLALVGGQLLSTRPSWPRSLLAGLAVALVGAEVWVASRGGLAATVLTVVLVAWMSRARGPEGGGVLSRVLPPGILALAGVGMILLSSSEAAVGELASTDTSKFDLARDALRIVPAFPVFGIGRGAFESVFPAFRTDPIHMVYTHPENVVAQWATEWGPCAALAAFAALALALRPATAMARSPRAAGAWTAIGAVGAQNLVDFGSEYPAVVIALAVCAGIVTGGTRGTEAPKPLDAWASAPSRVVVAAVAATLVALALALPGRGRDVFDDRAALHDAALDPTVSRADFEARAAAAMLRHPAEPYLPFTGALRAVRAGDASLLPWIDRTLDRAIVYGPAHLLLARWLAPRSQSQARLEYRLTLEQAPELSQYVLPAVGSLIHGYDDALEVLPQGPGRVTWVNYLLSSLAIRLPATARRLDELVLEADPHDPAYLERRAQESLLDAVADGGVPWCAGEARAECLREGLDRSARLVQAAPGRCAGHSTHARLLIESGDPARAIRELRAAVDGVTDRTPCYQQLADLAQLARSDDTVTFALDRITHAGCAVDAECVTNLRFVASCEVSRGNLRSALVALQRARQKAPDDDDLLEHVAALAGRVDLHVESLRAYQLLATRHPADPRWTAAVDAEQQKRRVGAIPY